MFDYLSIKVSKVHTTTLYARRAEFFVRKKSGGISAPVVVSLSFRKVNVDFILLKFAFTCGIITVHYCCSLFSGEV